MADKNGRQSSHKVTAPELLLKVVLVGTQAHYENRGMIDDTRLDHLQRAGQQILYKSHQESDVRCVELERSVKVDMQQVVACFARAYPTLTNVYTGKTLGSLPTYGKV